MLTSFILRFCPIFPKLSVLSRAVASSCVRTSVEKRLKENFIIQNIFSKLIQGIHTDTEKQMPFMGISSHNMDLALNLTSLKIKLRNLL